MTNKLAKKFTFSSLLLFAMPNIIMMVFLSAYVIVDGIFISNFIGTIALSATNIVFPIMSLEMAISLMISSGGSAIIARKMGEGRNDEARENFTFLIVIEVVVGLLFAILGNLFIKQIVTLLGATEKQLPYCIDYLRLIFYFAPAVFLQTAFQTFFVTAGKPTLGLIVTVFAGVTNMVLDYIFIHLCDMGIGGAALATGLGNSIPAIIGLIYFIFNKKNPLRFVKPKMDKKGILLTCANGSSEMVTNLANAVTTILFNFAFLKYRGEDGVAAITIILYLQFVYTALYFGYSNGIAPIISYKYGCHDKKQLQGIIKNSILFIIISAVLTNILIHLTIKPTIGIFAPVGGSVYEITLHGFSLYWIAFAIMGIGIFASSIFTAFSDGKTSAIISFSRTFLFIVGAILLLPLLLGETGVWLAVPIAEALGLIISIFYLIKKRSYWHESAQK